MGKVETLATANALSGTAGNDFIVEYNGHDVLSSYQPVDLDKFSWAIVAEIDQDEAFLGISQMLATMAGLVIVAIILLSLFAIFISKLISKPIYKLGEAIQKVEKDGDFSLSLDNRNLDEIGITSRAFNALLLSLSKAINDTNSVLLDLGNGQFENHVSEEFSGQLNTLAKGVNGAVDQVKSSQEASVQQASLAKKNSEKAESAAQQASEQAKKAEEQAKKAEELAEETMIVKQALDVSATAMSITDENHVIIYGNEAALALMKNIEKDLEKEIASFKANAFIGMNMQAFASTESDAELAEDLVKGYKTQVGVSGLTLNVAATPIHNVAGIYLGAVVEWSDETQEIAKNIEEKRISDTNARIRQALDNSSTGTMIADANFDIIYINQSLRSVFRSSQAALDNHFGSFSLDSIVGSKIFELSKDPEQAKSSLAKQTDPIRDEINAGRHSFVTVSNPILSPGGERLGTVVEWIDRSNEASIEQEIDGVIDAAAQGDFARRIELNGKRGFFLNVSNGLNQLLETTNVAIADIGRIFSALASGDLSQTIEREYQGEFAKLKSDANGTILKLQQVMQSINSSSSRIAAGAEEISSGNSSLGQRTEQQAATLEETASSMEEITTIVQQSEERAQSVNSLALRSVEIARTGDESVKATSKAMEEIALASSKINNIISVINEIAFQTNLLALNAAVEAARAGEQGRGFAVVAAEVRGLAQRSASASKEIKLLIQDSSKKVEEGAELVSNSGETLTSIVTEIEQVSKNIDEVLVSAREQTAGIQQVSTAVHQMDQMTQENAALVEEAAAASEGMAQQALELEKLVAFFKVGDASGQEGNVSAQSNVTSIAATANVHRHH